MDTPSPAHLPSHNGCAFTPHKTQSQTLYLHFFWAVIGWEVAQNLFIRLKWRTESNICKINSRRHKGSDRSWVRDQHAPPPQKTQKDEQKADLTLMSREACRYLETRARSLSFARAHRINKHWRADAQHPPLYSGLNIRWGGVGLHPSFNTMDTPAHMFFTASADRALVWGSIYSSPQAKNSRNHLYMQIMSGRCKTVNFNCSLIPSLPSSNTQAPVKDRLNGFSVLRPRPGVRCNSVFMWKHTCACATMNRKALLTLLLNTHRVNLGGRTGWISKFIQSALLRVSCGHEIAEDPIPRLTAKSAQKHMRVLQERI